MSKKELFNNISSKSGASFLLRIYKNMYKNELPILAYHRVINHQEKFFPNDIELISSSPKMFEKQIKYICRHYQPITFKMFSNNHHDPKSFKKPPIIITFDDGFYDNYKIVYPILKKYDAQATFFLVTNTLDTDEPLWFDLLAYLIMKTDKSSILIQDKEILLSNDIRTKRKIIEKILLDVRQIDNKDRLKIVEELKKQLRYSIDYAKTTNYLSWNNVREMYKNGMEFGSHSVSHPILAQTSTDQIKNELSQSKERIEEMLQDECKTFAYPVGGFEEYNDHTLNILKEIKYSYACTYEPGINKIPIKDKFQLRRIHVERYNSFNFFKNNLISSFFGYK